MGPDVERLECGIRLAQPALVSLASPKDAGTTYEIDPLSDSRWESFVQNHPRGSVFHSTGWLRALRNVYGYRPVAITTCPPAAPLSNSIVFCEITSWLTGRRFVSLPFSDHCDPLSDNLDEVDALLSCARKWVHGKSQSYVEIRPRSWEPNAHCAFRPAVTYYFHRLDLRASMPELIRRFHKDCVQRKIRRAEREKLNYQEGISEELLQSFYKLLVMTRRRQYLPPQPLSWFRGLIAAFGHSLKIRVAYKNQLPVASILTLSHKRSVVYKYGCSDAGFNSLGGMALLFWKTIQEAKDQGFEELDLGRSDIDNLGLIAFKEHWGARGSPITYWTCPHAPSSLPSWWKKYLVPRLISSAPDLALKAIGNIAYKHVG